MRLLVAAGWIALGMAPWAAASAQPIVTPGIAVHRYHEVGEPVMAVDVWGSIRLTGRFFLPTDTGLLELLTLSGGPPSQTETEEVIRDVTVTLTRAGVGGRGVIFEAVIDSLATGAAVAPPLRDGDIVTVTTSVRRPFDWRDALSIATTVAAGVLLLLRIATIAGVAP